ncbi:MAG TPA: dienelactone hydrolase family protein [Actinomycetota bacterium]|nr:dienelactone hydrolase family protein [Actinomycetota bacterium]
MGQMIEFPANGGSASGYLAAPDAKGPGIVVIQEWWGMVDHIKDVCDRFAKEGFLTLAPDLYNGEQTTEPDEASKKMMELDIEEAAKKMSGAFRYLEINPMLEPNKFGCVGFCMGGALSMVLGTLEPIDAVVTYYGGPFKDPDYSKMTGAVLGHFAEHDDWATPDYVARLFEKLKSLGRDAEFFVYPDTHHAFFNDSRPEVYSEEAAELSWDRTLEFFRKHLKG